MADAIDDFKPIQYTIFLIDGGFGDICEPDVGYLRFDAVSQEEMKLLLTLAMRSDYDMVIRRYEEAGDDEQE